MIKKFLLAAVLLAGTPLAHASAQQLPDYFIGAVAEVVAHKDKPFNSETRIKQGSGVFADHNGCLYTNAHVVLNVDTGELDPYLQVNVSTDRADRAQELFEGEVVFVDQGIDLAYVCPRYDHGVFTEFFDRVNEPMFAKRKFGEEVWVMGYPVSGEGTITASPGHIIGFIHDPDAAEWLASPALESDSLKMYKTDALSGPGVSGGVMVNSNLELIGIPFAGTLLPGAFIFSLSEDVRLEFDRRMTQHFYQQALVPLDCVYDAASSYYTQSGQNFYDRQCALKQDLAMEREIKTTYKAFCATEISEQHLIAGAKRSIELGDLSAWSDNLEKRCGKPSIIEPVAYAYGQARVADETAKSDELKNALGGKPKGISDTNWQTLVNAYAYGHYPASVISRAVQLGGVTVHPSIPFEAWQGSAEYKKGMAV